MDHDDPNATYQTSPATVVYGGSGPQTSDYLRLSAQTDPSVPVSTYQWSVSGNASSPYTPINTQQWTVGQIKTTTGQLNVHLVVNFSDGSTGSSDISFNIGIRTDDIAVVGWINPAGVPLPTAGVRSDVLQYFPSAGASTMGVIQKGLTTGYLGVLMLGLPLTPSAYEQALSNGISYILNPTTALGSFDVTAATLALEQLFGFNIFLDSTSSAYILDWMFHEAGNDCNVGKCPPNSFPDYSTLNNYEQDQYRGQYKLFNRLQIKYEVSSGNFSGSPAVVHRNKQIGITGDPLFGLVSAGEAGPSNNQYQIKNSNEAHYVNEGSPDRKAVLIFNTLAYPLKWNDIGSRIVEGVAFGTGKQYFVQVYPTYNIYTNLSQQDAQIPEAATPMGNFNSNPYYVTTPYGPAPFLIP